MSKPKWLEIAEAELGVHEIPGPEATARIVEYDSHTTLKAVSDEIPWCSAFANFCMDEAGIPGTHSAAARSWLTWGVPISTPVEGCIVVLKRGDNPAQGHVGFFVAGTADLIKVLGGNQHDSVSYSLFRKSQVVGYCWPEGVAQ